MKINRRDLLVSVGQLVSAALAAPCSSGRGIYDA